jgi:hypothetical protein
MTLGAGRHRPGVWTHLAALAFVMLVLPFWLGVGAGLFVVGYRLIVGQG